MGTLAEDKDIPGVEITDFLRPGGFPTPVLAATGGGGRLGDLHTAQGWPLGCRGRLRGVCHLLLYPREGDLRARRSAGWSPTSSVRVSSGGACENASSLCREGPVKSGKGYKLKNLILPPKPWGALESFPTVFGNETWNVLGPRSGASDGWRRGGARGTGLSPGWAIIHHQSTVTPGAGWARFHHPTSQTGHVVTS